MITQQEALEIANELFLEQRPYAVDYGYHIKRGVNAKEVHEFLESPLIMKTKADMETLIRNFLSKEKVTRDNPSRVTGFDVLYQPINEGLKTKTIKVRVK